MGRVCPFGVGYLLISPLRKMFQDPLQIVGPFIQPGMAVLDIGSGMGYFSLPMAKIVGAEGKVICLDLQERMIRVLNRRAVKQGVANRTEGRVCQKNSLGIGDLEGRIDFALAFALVHEVPDPAHLFAQIYTALKPGGKLLFSEPKIEVSDEDFKAEVRVARRTGFLIIGKPQIALSRSTLLQK